MLTKRITKVGGSGGIVLDRTVLDILGAQIGDELQLDIHGDEITLRRVPASAEQGRRRRPMRPELAAVSEKMVVDHAETFRKLAK
jgi:antitoxin component of MazEF toxin-antitoxin module